jgi:transcriptional regulator with XRE-family HTH domain
VLRRERGLTQERLAAAAGISHSTISRIESGEVSGSVRSLTSIARVLEVPIGELVA